MSVAWLLLAALGDGSAPADEPALDPSTLRSLGAVWTIRGDDNRNARVDLAWRKSGDAAWRPGAPLLRVERGASKREVPDGTWLFAGSVVLLEPETPYELKLTL